MDVQLVTSSGVAALDSTAVNWILQKWRFPADVTANLSQPIQFALTSSSAIALQAPSGSAPSIRLPAGMAEPDLPSSQPASAVAASGAVRPAPAKDDKAADPSESSMLNLVRILVKRGVLTKEDAADVSKQAVDEAAEARSQKLVIAQQAAMGPAPVPAPAPPAPVAADVAVANEDDSVTATYIPSSVRKEMVQEIKEDVMTQARDENWAAPRKFPNWLSRITFFGDARVRYEDQMFPKGNDNSGSFPNFNAINTGSPVDLSQTRGFPFYNVDQDRQRYRLRLRFGADVILEDGFTTGFRIGTGSDDSPVTENQTLGGANGQGGDFGKYQIWLDRGFIKYTYGTDPDRTGSITVGRFDNPFMHTSMIWADDLAFDGLAIQGKYKATDGVIPFGVLGAFPVYNTDFNFGTTSPAKFSSENKFLYAIQGGTEWKINDDFTFKGALAYYDYETVQGKLSDPFIPLASTDQGNTDDSRPAFAQNGNTYFPIRNIDNSGPLNGNGTTNQFQYYGLANAYREAVLTGQLDISHFDPFHIQLYGEAVENLAFNRTTASAIAVNNQDQNGNFAGGDMGYLFGILVGAPKLQKRWDWNVNLNYRYVQSDAVVDGFTDSDFGGSLAGTNLQGYVLGGNVALSPHVWLNLRWMSADAIAGPTYKNDLIQFDVNCKY